MNWNNFSIVFGRVIYGTGSLPGKPHYLARVKVQTGAKPFNIRLMGMTGKHRLVIAGSSHGISIKRIMGDCRFHPAKFQNSMLAMQFKMRILLGHTGNKKPVTVTIAKDTMNFTFEFTGKHPGRDR